MNNGRHNSSTLPGDSQHDGRRFNIFSCVHPSIYPPVITPFHLCIHHSMNPYIPLSIQSFTHPTSHSYVSVSSTNGKQINQLNERQVVNTFINIGNQFITNTRVHRKMYQPQLTSITVFYNEFLSRCLSHLPSLSHESLPGGC